MSWVAFGGLLAFGDSSRELAVFVEEDWFELGVGQTLALGSDRLTLPFRSTDCNGLETEAWSIEMVPRHQREKHLKMLGDVVFDKEALCVRNPVLPQLDDVVGTFVSWTHLHVLHVPAHLCLHLRPEMLKEHMAAEVGLEAGFGAWLWNGELLLAGRANQDLLQHGGLGRSAYGVWKTRLLRNKKAAGCLDKPCWYIGPCQAWSGEHVPLDALRSWCTRKAWRPIASGTRSLTSPSLGRLEPQLLACSRVCHDRSLRP